MLGSLDSPVRKICCVQPSMWITLARTSDHPPMNKSTIETPHGAVSHRSISQAITEYQDACQHTENPPFYDIVTALIERGYGEDFSNDSFFDALCLTHTMLMTSYSDVRILTGGGGSSFWKTLEKPFSFAVENLQKTGGKIRMIVLDPSTPCREVLAELKKLFGDSFEYVMATTKEKINHFVVCDSRMIRIEEPHTPITDESPDTLIKAKVNFRAPEQAKRQERLFDSFWEQLAKQ